MRLAVLHIVCHELRRNILLLLQYFQICIFHLHQEVGFTSVSKQQFVHFNPGGMTGDKKFSFGSFSTCAFWEETFTE